MNGRNSDMERLHADLIKTADELSKRMEAAATIDDVRALLVEIVEVNHRITVTGQLLFKAKTAVISDAVAKVTDARKDVAKAIKELEKVARVVRAVTKFLSVVDRAIDTAKLVF
jgi:cell fate (sporulation/competence/biofilm development) regulator YmcA (YheA/YmcA/DUF963 family)